MSRWRTDLVHRALGCPGRPAFFGHAPLIFRQGSIALHGRQVGYKFSVYNAKLGLLEIKLVTYPRHWPFPPFEASFKNMYRNAAPNAGDLEAAVDWFISALRPFDPGMARRLALARADWRTTSD